MLTEAESFGVVNASPGRRYECLRCAAQYHEKVEFCWACGESGLVLPRWLRPAEAMVPRPKPLTARNLATLIHRVIIASAYPDLKLGPGAFVVLHGGPGAGKSTMGLRLAESLQPALYLPLEEQIGPVLADRLKRLEVYAEGILFDCPRTLRELLALIERHQPRCVVIDSVQCSSLMPEDVLNMARSGPGIVVAISQQTKEGKLAGSNRWPHLADVCIRVQNLQWIVEKSRYQESGLIGDVP